MKLLIVSLKQGRDFREGLRPSLIHIPPSLNKTIREGGQGDRFPYLNESKWDPGKSQIFLGASGG